MMLIDMLVNITTTTTPSSLGLLLCAAENFLKWAWKPHLCSKLASPFLRRDDKRRLSRIDLKHEANIWRHYLDTRRRRAAEPALSMCVCVSPCQCMHVLECMCACAHMFIGPAQLVSRRNWHSWCVERQHVMCAYVRECVVNLCSMACVHV